MSSNQRDSTIAILPRIIRIRDAPAYLGMDKNRFNKEVRPQLTELKIGTQGIAFDRLDLDAWVDDYKSRVGRLDTRTQEKVKCQKRQRASRREVISGTSTKSSKESDFMKVLEQVTSKKRNAT